MDVNATLNTIAADVERGNIVFPTHAEIALRVQRLLDDPDCSLSALGKVVAAEPVLHARVLSVANSIAYNPGGRAITEIGAAISRLGFGTLRALAAAVVVRQMKELPRLPEHRALAGALWEHTAHVAALARTLARKVTHQNPDAAFFGGIVHEMGGFYLIARAASYPGLIEGDLEAWHGDGEARIGHAVLSALDTPPAILEALHIMWTGYLAMPPASLGDTLLLADQLTPTESPLDALAGMSRKGMNVELQMLVDDEELSEILAESADEVASLDAALKA
ncbi:HDOD domain-containing protein [Propionivibrio soli]|uniref:HDOD domain-containing protein n=1 Tax=Propionivibrio soli TaxID=2976531 RepID=UPI0021E7A184|nr:HDOD domain-containing protein [Propionivibrio soli]